MNWSVIPYSDLSLDDFHDILSLRVEVFVVEQDCVYQEVDGKDKASFHLIGKDEDNNILAYSRILPGGISYDEPSIGRVVVSKRSRNKGLGRVMMNECLNFMYKEFPGQSIRISAQTYLKKFYEEIGFQDTGKSYLEDGIPHLEMLLSK